MNFDQLNDNNKIDDPLLFLEQFKMGLVSRSTGGGFEDSEYKRGRAFVLSHLKLREIAPKFIKICRNIDDFWEWIKQQAPTYAERRLIISESLNPLLEVIEYESGEGSLEFSKNYEEKGIIGNGGFGIVYRYEHRLLKMPFAVKVFAPAFYDKDNTDKEIERFFQEARILFNLSHPNIIRVFDAGLIGNRPFIRMEFFEGKNLNQIIIDYGIIDQKSSVTAMINIVSAIQHAHDRGVIHRDLKPSNIMAAKPNQFRVIDFGLGTFIENELHSRLTKTGSQTISGYYNAPELVANPKLLDSRSDIYSLGAIWFTLLTGQPPAGSDFLEELKLLNIDKNVIDVIAKCLRPLGYRYGNCSELLNDIENLSKE